MDGVFRFAYHHLSLLAVCAALLSATACGGSGGGGGTSGFRPAVANPDSALIGAWEGLECNVTGTFSQSRRYVFTSAGTYDFTVDSFNNLNCSQPTFAISSSGNYFEGARGLSPDARDIVDLDIQQTTERSITPLSTLGADALNTDAVCGRNNWQVDVAQEIGGCQIGAVEDRILPTLFRVHHVQDNQFLYFSNELSFTAENRSPILQTRPIVVRQLPASADFSAEVSGIWRDDGDGRVLEFRSNGIFYTYVPSDTGASCFNLTTDAALNTGDGLFRTFSGQALNIVANGTTLQFNELPSGLSLQLTRAEDIEPGQLVPCSALPSG